MGSQPWIENTVFNPLLVESMNVKLWKQRVNLIFIEKKFMYKWTHVFQIHGVQGSIVLSFLAFVSKSVSTRERREIMCGSRVCGKSMNRKGFPQF